MARTESKMLPLGTKAPQFNLPDTEGQMVSLDSFKGSQGYLVIFMCNHCPYVKHIAQALSKLTAEYIKKNIAVMAVNSNDVENYPEDSPAMMIREKKEQHYEFPYLFDETQKIAKAYDAACTPDFFLFDKHQKLVYRGQFDKSRPGHNIIPTGEDLKNALDALISGKEISSVQTPSLGCNIKWK